MTDPLPTPRTFLTSLLNTLASSESPPPPDLNLARPTTVGANGNIDGDGGRDGNGNGERGGIINPLKRLPAPHRALLTTLHVLYPSVLLPALDVLDRRLVMRVFVVGEEGEGKGESTAASASAKQEVVGGGSHGVVAGDSGTRGDGGGGGAGRESAEEARRQEQQRRQQTELGSPPSPSVAPQPSPPDEEDTTTIKDDNIQQSQSQSQEQPTFHIVRSAQQQQSKSFKKRHRQGNNNSNNNNNNTASTPRKTPSTYVVRLRSWSCTCAAFAFAAYPFEGGGPGVGAGGGSGGGGGGYIIEPPISSSSFSPSTGKSRSNGVGGGDLGVDNGEGDEGKGKEKDARFPEWEFGGLSIDGMVDKTTAGVDGSGSGSGNGNGITAGVPVCKHLLACVLAERLAGSGLGLAKYMEERRVGREEGAGLVGDVWGDVRWGEAGWSADYRLAGWLVLLGRWEWGNCTCMCISKDKLGYGVWGLMSYELWLCETNEGFTGLLYIHTHMIWETGW